MTNPQRVALISGASGGIGSAIALALAKENINVAIHYNKSEEKAKAVKADCKAFGVQAEIFQADLSLMDEAEALVKSCVKHFGRLDILINNAGRLKEQFLMMLKETDWNQSLDINLSSAYRLSKASLRYLMKNKWGRIIQVSSLAGLIGDVKRVAYSSAKAGLIGFTKALAREVGGSCITVNAVCPGVIQTALIKDKDEAYFESIKSGTAVKRLGAAQDVAGAVAFLASDSASFITGEILTIDGGLGLGI